MIFQSPPQPHLSSCDRDEQGQRRGSANEEEIDFVDGYGVGVAYKPEDESTETNSSLPPCYLARDYQPPAQPSFPRSPQTPNETRSIHVSASNTFTATKHRSRWILLYFQVILLAITVVVWGVVVSTRKPKPGTDANLVGFHVLFIVVIVIQLVFLTRQFSISLLEEGEVLPRHRDSHSSTDSNVPPTAAPWNQPRPTLPTYGVVRAQSFIAPGDAEDNSIPTAPPPAYSSRREDTMVSIGMQ